MKEPVPVLQLVNQFAIGGAEVQFVARVLGHPQGFRPVVACVQRRGPLLGELLSAGIAVEEFGLKGSLAQLNTAQQVLRLAAFMRREGIKLVHANDFYANLLAVPAARLANAKVLVSRFDLAHWYSRAHHMLEAMLTRAADGVYANAEAVRDLCVHEEGVDPAKVEVVYNGIDLADFDRRSREPLQAEIPQLALGPDGKALRPTVVVAANLYPVKGHFDLIEAVEQVRRTIPDVLVLCAGKGDLRPALEQQIAERGLKDHVLLLGERRDCPALMARAHAGCQPSHAEGLSNAVIEAMAARLPVVGTAVGGNAELIVESPAPHATGFLLPPHQPAALADRLIAVLSDKERAKRYGKAARTRVEKELTLEVMARRTGEIYAQLLSAAPRTERKAA